MAVQWMQPQKANLNKAPAFEMWYILGEIYIDQVKSQYISYSMFTKEYYRFFHWSFLYSYLLIWQPKWAQFPLIRPHPKAKKKR